MKLKKYTIEKSAQIVLSLLKQKGIRRVIVSPGTTNIAIVGSMMNDPFFEMFSAPDERSAAYMACGMAAEAEEPVVISCTGATASRNYLPALTEAYYRKLPIVALTSSLPIGRSGHLYPQFIDRTSQPKDCVKYSAQIYPIHSPETEWNCVVSVNEALLELTRNGGGPIHINLMTEGEFADFSADNLPEVRNIQRYNINNMPEINVENIAIFVGSHKRFSVKLINSIERFCEKYNAVVFCDHTSAYSGKYKILYPIVATQQLVDVCMNLDLLIHIGEVSGDYYTLGRLRSSKEVWRVSSDGEIRDYFRHLSSVFQMEEEAFFDYYSEGEYSINISRFESCVNFLNDAYKRIPDLPFSNLWIASTLYDKMPKDCTIHFGILNSLRSWNFFPLNKSIETFCNVGGFGIDGSLSTVMGASLVNPNKLYFCFVGDLAFFYDLNALGNRYVGKNLRILLVNNGKGTEFRNYTHPAFAFGDDADKYIAAGGHYGNKSPLLVKCYAENLGFKYISADSKEDFLLKYENFLSPLDGNKSILFEVFTDSEQENSALMQINSLFETKFHKKVRSVKNSVKKFFSNDTK